MPEVPWLRACRGEVDDWVRATTEWTMVGDKEEQIMIIRMRGLWQETCCRSAFNVLSSILAALLGALASWPRSFQT